MTSKSMKPSTPARPGQLTKEQQEQAALRQFLQKREQITVTVLAGLVHNPRVFRVAPTPAAMADFAVETADAVLKKLYAESEKKDGEA